MSLWSTLRKGIGIVAMVGRPIMALVGVKGKTVVGKVVEGAEILDPVLPKEHPKP